MISVGSFQVFSLPVHGNCIQTRYHMANYMFKAN